MTINYATALKTARMQLVADLVASKTPVASSGVASAGQLVIGTSALAGAVGVLVAIPLSVIPATVAGSLLTIAGVPLTALAAASGQAAKAELRNNAGATIADGLTVGVSAADIIITTTTIVAGLPVTLTSGLINHG